VAAAVLGWIYVAATLAAFISLLAIIMVSIAIAFFIHMTGLDLAWCFLIVFGAYLLLAGILALIGYRKIRKVGPPQRTIAEMQEMRALKLEHLGIEEATDVLSFPIDGRDELPAAVPRQLGDVVLCPQVVGEAWRGPLVHGLLHLLGYDHGEEMERRERELLAER